MNAVGAIGNLITKYLPIWILIGLGIALWIPDSLAGGSPYSLYVVMGLMLLMGITLTPKDITSIAKKPVSILIGTACHYTVMPLLAYGVAWLLNLGPELTIGLVLLGCVASGSASNVMVYLAKGDLTLAVSLGLVSTFASILLTPLLVQFLIGELVSISASSMALDIAKMVVAPIAVGLLMKTFLPRLCEHIIPFVGPASGIALVFICSANFAAGQSAFLASGFIIIAAVLMHNLGGFTLGYLISRFTRRTEGATRAVTLETGMQNGGVAIVLAQTYFDPIAVLPSAVSGAVHVFTGSTLARFWAARTIEEEAPTTDASVVTNDEPELTRD
ncbi:bile acid:sodium symporter family protein [Rhodococcus sp. USK13]|jgi:BASS family bile acid:Na+ symporter|uniref:bile acid:sodium symporter family protein n=1 Tax=Rhodococcus sp. USK13 TaxID=2806442 RepID=UPI001BCB8912|nr:bile acid:sodium symporter family protein [Rhodococcus sp. USK13]